MPLSEAVVDAGAVRFRPMLLTAMAVVVGAASDPRRSDLPRPRHRLMAGEIASLLISRMAVPVLYAMRGRWIERRGGPGALADMTVVAAPTTAAPTVAAPTVAAPTVGRADDRRADDRRAARGVRRHATALSPRRAATWCRLPSRRARRMVRPRCARVGCTA
jgi:hypothetical protein